MLLNGNLTQALLNVQRKVTGTNKTVLLSDLSQDDRTLIKAGYFSLKSVLGRVFRDVDVRSIGLHYKLGAYQMSGRAYPHLWGALIPSEVPQPSHETPQMFVYRNDSIVHWGIGLSYRARDNEMFKEIFDSFLIANEGRIGTLGAEGIVISRSIANAEDLDGEIASESTIIHKSHVLKEFEVDDERLADEIRKDFMTLMPLYQDLITKMRAAKLLPPPEARRGRREAQAPRHAGPSWQAQWSVFWNSPEAIADQKVPNYLQAEFGTEWESTRQCWEIGRRELLAAVEAAVEDKDPGHDRVTALVMSSLRRTRFTGGWRSAVRENFSSIAKYLSDFVKRFPKGCENDDLEELLDSLRPLTDNTRIYAAVTRWLADLAPGYYLPISEKFTKNSLIQASFLLENRQDAQGDDFKSMCLSAQRLARFLPDINDEIFLMEFDYFLFWLHDSYKSGAAPHSEELVPEGAKGTVRYWKISCGSAGRYAGVHKESGRISIGWDTGADLSSFSNIEDLKDRLREIPGFDNDVGYSVRQCWMLSHEVAVGDIIFGYGRGNILLVGEVSGPYEYFEDASIWSQLSAIKSTISDQHTVPVKWRESQLVDAKTLPEELYRQLTRVQTIIELDEKSAQVILERAFLDEDGSKEGKGAFPGIDIRELCQKTGLEAEFFVRIKRRLNEKKQIIFSGPPGTGKTFVADLFAQWVRSGKGETLPVQFHPSYSYEDFIEGFRPSETGGGFVAKDGCFKEFCLRASRSPLESYFVIIDEINRGNLAQIFGEALTLLEYRDKDMVLPYSKKTFNIPSNVYIIGTMNTADRSIALMDFALRRRFDFVTFNPEEGVLLNHLERSGCVLDVRQVADFLYSLNQIVSAKMGEQYQIGHSYLMRDNLDLEKLRDIWDYSLMPLLEEYFFDQRSLIKDLDFESLWIGATSPLKRTA